MKARDKLELLKEINSIEEEATKYNLGNGNLRIFFVQHENDPNLFSLELKSGEKLTVTESETDLYLKHSGGYKIIYASNTRSKPDPDVPTIKVSYEDD